MNAEPPESLRSCPYQGLAAYSEQDFPFFFGREPETEIVSANLRAFRLTLLYGGSGVGKSSLVQAGIEHELGEQAARDVLAEGRPEFVPVVFRSWTEDPKLGLEDRVKHSIAKFVKEDGVPAKLQREDGLARNLDSWTRHLELELLIILDQFEEYFLYHGQDDREHDFGSEVAQIVNAPETRINFLIAIRDDALSLLDRFTGDIPGLFDNYLRVEPLDIEAAEAAITAPIEEYNRQNETNRFAIEPRLVDRVIDSVRLHRVHLAGDAHQPLEGTTPQEGVSGQVAPAYLQLVMKRLWEEEVAAGSHVLRVETIDRLGGAEEILRSHVGTSMESLRSVEQDAAASVFRYLVTPSGMKIAHSAPDLAEYTGLTPDLVMQVVVKLCESETRVLKPVERRAEEAAPQRYEIGHDLLAPAVLDWSRGHAHDVARRKLRWRLGGVAGVSLVALAATLVWLIGANSDLREQKDEANDQRVEAERELRRRSLLPNYQFMAYRILRRWRVDEASAGKRRGGTTYSYIRFANSGQPPQVVSINRLAPRKAPSDLARYEEDNLEKNGRDHARISFRPRRRVTELQFVIRNREGDPYSPGSKERRVALYFNSGRYSYSIKAAAKGRQGGKEFRSARDRARRVLRALMSGLAR